MAERIVHISDLHFGRTERAETGMLVEAITRLDPSLIVCSGDLTAQGRLAEFTASFAFLSRLPWKQVVVPGNHDVPHGNLWKRAVAPFGRFISTRGGALEEFRGKAMHVLAVETTKAVQFSLDWSLGVVDDDGAERAEREFRATDRAALRILVTHHPLWPSRLDMRRSKTKGGPKTLAQLTAAGAEIHLHGHLHQASAEIVETPGGRILVIGAGSALSDRVRDEAASFNVIDADLETGLVEVRAVSLGADGYEAGAPQRFLRAGAPSGDPHWPSRAPDGVGQAAAAAVSVSPSVSEAVSAATP